MTVGAIDRLYMIVGPVILAIMCYYDLILILLKFFVLQNKLYNIRNAHQVLEFRLGL